MDNENSFVELGRVFHKLSDLAHKAESDDVDIQQAFHIGDHLHWEDINEKFRVILLAEAGSGKTSEIRQNTIRLREEEKCAFFIRLEYVGVDFESAFEEGTFEEFQNWLNSDTEGWIFFDSVDEARLKNPKDFESAIRILAKKLKPSLERLHIMITSRETAWRAKTDLDLCKSKLGIIREPAQKILVKEDNSDLGFFETELENISSEIEVKDFEFNIYTLLDLNSDQISKFIESKGIGDTQDFLDAVERSGAEIFTTRPQDLEELVDYWKAHGSIGTRYELIENSVSRRLVERDQDRAEVHALDQRKITEGVEELAAATTLIQNPNICIHDGANSFDGIHTKDVLPTWTDKESQILLSRPIFDMSIYGSVRFHHRTVREFLVAKWILRKLENGGSRRYIESLLFKNVYGLDVIVPSMRLVIPWLILEDDEIRAKVSAIEPDVFFEGGDPSRLPYDFRKQLLIRLCERIEAKIFSRSAIENAAVQRFANDDLIDDIQALLARFEGNPEIVSFLMRMIWQGNLADCLHDVKRFASNPQQEKYSRMAAILALKEIGSLEDYKDMLAAYKDESDHLDRRMAALIIEGLDASAESASWVLKLLPNLARAEKYNTDGLSDAIADFVEKLIPQQIYQFVKGAIPFLNEQPVKERRYCEVSERYSWLMECAVRGIEKLIDEQHPLALEDEVLSVLNRLNAYAKFFGFEARKTKKDFIGLIPSFKELNSRLFWYGVAQARLYVDKKKGERLTTYWPVQWDALWKFNESDFQSVCNDIDTRELLDDKLVAVSLAFDLYREAGRPRKWREKLKKSVVDEPPLQEALNNFLRPPPMSDEIRQLKQSNQKRERKYKRQELQRARKEAAFKALIVSHVDDIRNTENLEKGLYTNIHQYLWDQMRQLGEGKNNRSGDGNWKCLIPEFGEPVAKAFKDWSMAHWRKYTPVLPSETKDNIVSYNLLFGLIGLEIESQEVNRWPHNLNPDEALLAAKYALKEINGLPDWFEKLYLRFPKIVKQLCLNEIQKHLAKSAIEKHDTSVLSTVCWSAKWFWDDLARDLLNLLEVEPINLSHLENLLTIVNSSNNIEDGQIAELAKRKCDTIIDLNHMAYWLATWVGVEAEAGIAALERTLAAMEADGDEIAINFAMGFAVNLLGGRSSRNAAVRDNFRKPKYLMKLYHLLNLFIRVEDDINRADVGVYSPELRDDAQDARSAIYSILKDIPGKETYHCLMELAQNHPHTGTRVWMEQGARDRAILDGEFPAMSAADFQQFSSSLDFLPHSNAQLFELAILRIGDLKDDLEKGDTSNAGLLIEAKETRVRNFIAGWLRDRSHGRYSIQQEDELADGTKPDLRFQGAGIDAPVPIELKIADAWTGPVLLERMENQLCKQYLRDVRSGKGIYLLVCKNAETRWEPNGNGKRVDFQGLLETLDFLWKKLAPDYTNIEAIQVIGIDLSKRF